MHATEGSTTAIEQLVTTRTYAVKTSAATVQARLLDNGVAYVEALTASVVATPLAGRAFNHSFQHAGPAVVYVETLAAILAATDNAGYRQTLADGLARRIRNAASEDGARTQVRLYLDAQGQWLAAGKSDDDRKKARVIEAIRERLETPAEKAALDQLAADINANLEATYADQRRVVAERGAQLSELFAATAERYGAKDELWALRKRALIGAGGTRTHLEDEVA